MEIQLIIISLILSAFFSGIEIAYVSANKLKLELYIKRGNFISRLLGDITKTPSKFMATTLVGNNIALVVLGIMMARQLENWGMLETLPPIFQTEFVGLLLQTLITTALVLTLSEFLPKAIFRINPSGILQVFTLPFWLIFQLLHITLIVPLVRFSTTFILGRIFGVHDIDNKSVFSKVDLEHFVKQFMSTDADDEDDIDTGMLEKALTLTEIKARECMVPRPEIEAVEVNTSMDELRDKFVKSRHSKILVYEETIDKIIGYVHHFDLLKRPENIRDILFPIRVVPETVAAEELLDHFIKDQKTIAWVVDEYGGTAGIVTLEDVLEEIFGEIEDEHDGEDFIERQISKEEYIFSGRLEVDYLNEKYPLDFPAGEYETLAGYIVSQHESIPVMNEEIEIDHFYFTILNVSDTRIELVKLKVKPTEVIE